MKLAFWSGVFILAPLGALAAPPAGPDAGVAPPAPGDISVVDSRKPVRERFPNLDAYLAHLRQRSHLDGAWYREIRPGVYQLQTGNLRLSDAEAANRTFTREELERKFGFRQ